MALLEPGSVAVVTGAALGIGRAACRRFAEAGLSVVMVDLPSPDLDAAADAIRTESGAERVHPFALSVADRDGMLALGRDVVARLGVPAVLMNNAVTRIGGGVLEDTSAWRESFDTNFWGVVNGVDAFAEPMIAAGRPGYIVNVGSKQGITNPPGNTVYNVAKSAIKTYTEALQHALRQREGCQVGAHLLVPGFTATGKRPPRPEAWRPEQVVERMLERIERGSFYIVCPDNEVSEAMDRKRILWSAMDVTEDRPPLSRWAGDYDEAFAAFEPPRGG